MDDCSRTIPVLPKARLFRSVYWETTVPLNGVLEMPNTKVPGEGKTNVTFRDGCIGKFPTWSI